MPALLGKPLSETLQILSDLNLNARILSQKEDNDLIEGTIISQMPSAQRKIRPHQSVFLVISKKSLQKKAPNFLQKDKATIDKIAQEQSLLLKIYYIPSNYPQDYCIGQFPSPQQIIFNNRMIIYLSNSCSNKLVILPSFKQHNVLETTEFLTEKEIKFSLSHSNHIDDNHSCKNCRIFDQKPLAGSLIDLKKSFLLQLNVQSYSN